MKLESKLKSDVASAAAKCVEARYARINWKAHIVPTVKSAYSEFRSTLDRQGLQESYLSVLSEEPNLASLKLPDSALWGDSITISFGNRPVPVKPIFKVGKELRVLSEHQSSLVISVTVSGAVTAVIYPPESVVSKSEKKYYVVMIETDPSSITESTILGILYLTFEIDLFCGVRIFPNRRGGRLMAKLHAKDAVLAGGGSRLWVWISYIWSATTRVLRIYGIGKPVP